MVDGETSDTRTDSASVAHLARQQQWSASAGVHLRTEVFRRAYYARLHQIYQWLIPAGQRVLELGSGTGDLLAALKPSVGTGIDLSAAAVSAARQRHPSLEFIEGPAEQLLAGRKYDVVILSDLVNDLWDVQAVLERVHAVCEPGTRVILNTHSQLWRLPLTVARRLGLAKPMLAQNWLTTDDLDNLLQLTGFETLRHWEEYLCPAPIPGIATLANRVLVKLWPFRLLALTNMIVARPRAGTVATNRNPTVSVIVPARNEAGNIAKIFERVPEMGAGTELVFVEGHSRDDTYAAIERGIAAHPERRCRMFRQTGEGKGDAVRLGFEQSTGDVLMILDADLTMPPEDLPRFFAAIASGHGEFINGVRLVYPMEDEAMRFFNLLGNKFFSMTFSWLLGQPIKDTLCGTKVLWRSDYDQIVRGRAYFGDFDPFGDFDLLFGAAKLSRKVVEMPVRYRQRVYGETNIRRWSHGWLLLKMAAFASTRIKFV